MSINCMQRAGALGAVTLFAAALCGVAPAGAATATPDANPMITVTTQVHNAGHGNVTPDFFTYHVLDTATSNDVADGVFNHNGITTISLPPGTYQIVEDPLGEFTEHVSSCSNVTISAGHNATCGISNVWTPATILVSTTVDNSAGGSAKPSDFGYHVVDTSDNHTVLSGTFDNSGTTTVNVPDGTYSIKEVPLNGYVEDVSACAGITIDLADPGSCIVSNTFDPHTTTTVAPSTTLPTGAQVSVSGSVTTTTACLMTLVPALQDPATSNLTLTLKADAFPQPHKGDPITLTNTTMSVGTPASLIQTGVAVGVIHDGDTIPEHVKLVLAGQGTTQGSHTYTFSVNLKIVVKAGEAQPLVVTASLPNTTWTPNNAADPVFFAEQSLQLQSTISSEAIGTVRSTFTCNTPSAPTLIGLSAQGSTPPTRGPDGGTTPGGGGAGGNGATSGTSTATLPVTGTSVWLWLAPAIAFIYLGLLAIGATARKRRRALNS